MKRVKEIDDALKNIDIRLKRLDDRLVIKSNDYYLYEDARHSTAVRITSETADTIKVLIRADLENQRERLKEELIHL